jgi:hypothetical protein
LVLNNLRGAASPVGKLTSEQEQDLGSLPMLRIPFDPQRD